MRRVCALFFLPALVASIGCNAALSVGSEPAPVSKVRTQSSPPPTRPYYAPDAGTTSTPDADLSGCPADACSPGQTKCEGAGYATCEADPNNAGCGVWGTVADCSGPGQTCIEGRCQIPTGCVDNDGDGYGQQCQAGDDCDDSDPNIHPNAPELCDTIDNNCDGQIDEGLGLGAPCTSGSGACQASGFTVCAADGTTRCDAMAMGTPEVCDGVDNDCDGVIDNGVCGMCQNDPNEPNDSSATATSVQPNQPLQSELCPTDTDWYDLKATQTQDYRIYVTFPESVSDLKVEGYVDGQNVVTGDTAGSDYEVFVVHGNATQDFQIQVINKDMKETSYRVSLVDNWNCDQEDGFVPNQTIDEAAPFQPNWVTSAYMCPATGTTGLSDFYDLGQLAAGDMIDAACDGTDAFSTDLDLYLWGDPQGDGTYEVVAQSAGFGASEEIQTAISTAGEYFLEVFDYDGYGGNYDVGWTK